MPPVPTTCPFTGQPLTPQQIASDERHSQAWDVSHAHLMRERLKQDCAHMAALARELVLNRTPLPVKTPIWVFDDSENYEQFKDAEFQTSLHDLSDEELDPILQDMAHQAGYRE